MINIFASITYTKIFLSKVLCLNKIFSREEVTKENIENMTTYMYFK